MKPIVGRFAAGAYICMLAFSGCNGAETLTPQRSGIGPVSLSRELPGSCGGLHAGHFAVPRGRSEVSEPANFRLAVVNSASASAELLNRRFKQVGTIGQGLSSPTGVSFDEQENLYVANAEYSGGVYDVQEYAKGATQPSFTYSAGLGPSGPYFGFPNDVATDSNANVYVASGEFVRCQGYDGSVVEYGQHQNVDLTGCNFYADVSGIAVDAAGDLFIGESGNSFGEIAEHLAGTSPCAFRILPVTVGFTGGLRMDSHGTLVVADQSNGAVDLIAPPYKAATQLITGMNDPTAVALDSSETHLFVADNGSSTVWVFGYPSGKLLTILGSEHGVAGPVGIAAFPHASPMQRTAIAEDAASRYTRTVLSTNPIAYFPLNSAKDGSVPKGYATILLGGATISTPGAILSDPKNNYLSLTDQAYAVTGLQGSIPGTGSMVAWVNLSELPSNTGTYFFISGESQDANDFDLQFQNDNNIYFYTGSGEHTMYVTNPSQLVGQWNMVAVSYQGGSNGFRNIYWNGKLVAPYNGPVSASAKQNYFTMGESLQWINRYLQGGIDAVAVWNRALTSREIRRFYEAAQ